MHDNNEDIWQSHSMKFLEMAFRTDRQESLQHADGRGKKSTDCGDSIEFFLTVKDQRIESISYAHSGCINTNACANAVVELADGRLVEEAWAITPTRVAQLLESLGDQHFHCAELAVSALETALADVREKRRSPWKKLYN